MGHRWRLRRAIALAGAALLIVPIFVTPAHASLATPYTHAFFQWQDGAVMVDTDYVTVLSSSATTVGFLVNGGTVVFGMVAPAGQNLGVGDYEDVVFGTSPTAANAAVLLDASAQCTVGTGRVQVDDLAIAGDGTLLSFSARLAVNCNGRTMYGALSLQSTADYRTRTITLTPATFPPVAVGSHATSVLTISNNGPSDLRNVLMASAGDPDEFDIRNNKCSDVPGGRSCTATIDYHPLSPGQKSASILLVDGDYFGALVIPLTASAVAAPPPVLRNLTLSPGSIDFGPQRVGTYNFEHDITLRNTGNAAVHLHEMFTASDDIFGGTNCPVTLNPGDSCSLGLYFAPVTKGTRRDTLVVTSDATNGTQRVPLSGRGTLGYYLARSSGATSAFGDALPRPSQALPSPVVALAATRNGGGYWLVDSRGVVGDEGNADFKGDLSHVVLAQPIVGISRTATGNGYWLVASDGGIFSFGDAKFHGSTGAIRLNKPIVGMASTVSGKGYWLVASDGGIFSFGDAKFYGSTGAMRLNKPIVGMAATPSGRGYWLVASDGGIFAFGDARFYGSTGAIHLTSPIAGMSAAPDGRGYWFVARDGGLFSFGPSAEFDGSLGGQGVDDVVGMAGTAPPVTWVFGSSAAFAANKIGGGIPLPHWHPLGTIAPAWAARLTN